ncbi:MAG: DUF4384 domain-containing protein [Rhodobacteraceae bacterium]|nr:MAG: DUF4384 domain-containing protein [Paracoccaceae bacterium]
MAVLTAACALRARTAACAVLAVLFCASGAAAEALSTAARALNEDLSIRIDCRPGETRQVGIYPFETTRLPIPPDNAFALYEAFLGELLRFAPPCISYIDGRGAYVTLDYLTQSGRLHESGQDHLLQIRDRLEGVDYVMDGSIIDQTDGLVAVFRLTDFSAGTAVARAQFLVPERFQATRCGAGAMPIAQTVETAVRALLDRAGRLERLTVVGGYYGQSDVQTSFSRYLESEIVGQISRQAARVITGHNVQITYLRDTEATGLRNLRGLTISGADFDAQALRVTHEDRLADSAEPQADLHRLMFRYWVCEGDLAARLSITLTGPQGHEVQEITSIRLDNLPAGLALHPDAPPPPPPEPPARGVSLQISSNRGPNPVFQAGERLELLLRSDADAWFHCFYTDSADRTIQILPNPFQQSHTNAHFYEGSMVHLFPDPQRSPVPDPFELVINADTHGVETLTCFATREDISLLLPPGMRGESLHPLPQFHATRLHDLFIQAAGGAVGHARLTVTILP